MKIIKSEKEVAIKIMGSSFNSYLFRIESEEDIDAHLTEIKEKHSKATHIVYGYRFQNLERFNDDQEPIHSAGYLLLELLKEKDVQQAMIITVRYFGGTKLGLPRLRRAYKEGGLLLLEDNLVEAAVGFKAEVEVPYELLRNVNYQLTKIGLLVETNNFPEKAILLLRGSVNMIQPSRDYLSRQGLSFNPVPALFIKE